MKLLFLVLILLSCPSLLLAERSDAPKRLSHYLSNLDSYEANFQQQLISGSRRLMETTSGRFLMKRPNRFRWQINAPYEQTVIADGKYIWSIDIDLEQVTVADIDESLANSPIMLLSQKNNQLQQYFSVELMEVESDLERFILKPNDSSSNFELIQLAFKDGILQLIELHDSLGQITIVTMSNIRNNPVLDNKPFVYQEMPDFDVIDSRKKVTGGD